MTRTEFVNREVRCLECVVEVWDDGQVRRGGERTRGRGVVREGK